MEIKKKEQINELNKNNDETQKKIKEIKENNELIQKLLDQNKNRDKKIDELNRSKKETKKNIDELEKLNNLIKNVNDNNNIELEKIKNDNGRVISKTIESYEKESINYDNSIKKLNENKNNINTKIDALISVLQSQNENHQENIDELIQTLTKNWEEFSNKKIKYIDPILGTYEDDFGPRDSLIKDSRNIDIYINEIKENNKKIEDLQKGLGIQVTGNQANTNKVDTDQFNEITQDIKDFFIEELNGRIEDCKRKTSIIEKLLNASEREENLFQKEQTGEKVFSDFIGSLEELQESEATKKLIEGVNYNETEEAFKKDTISNFVKKIKDIFVEGKNSNQILENIKKSIENLDPLDSKNIEYSFRDIANIDSTLISLSEIYYASHKKEINSLISTEKPLLTNLKNIFKNTKTLFKNLDKIREYAVNDPLKKESNSLEEKSIARYKDLCPKSHLDTRYIYKISENKGSSYVEIIGNLVNKGSFEKIFTKDKFGKFPFNEGVVEVSYLLKEDFKDLKEGLKSVESVKKDLFSAVKNLLEEFSTKKNQNLNEEEKVKIAEFFNKIIPISWYSKLMDPWTADHLFDGTFLKKFNEKYGNELSIENADSDYNEKCGDILSLFDILASIKERASKLNKIANKNPKKNE